MGLVTVEELEERAQDLRDRASMLARESKLCADKAEVLAVLASKISDGFKLGFRVELDVCEVVE